MTDDLPDERTVTTSDGDEVTVRETVDAVEVSASRRKQLDQYEPIEELALLKATKPDAGLPAEEFDAWLESLADIAWAEAERGVMARWEQYVREESFGDD
jgi:hypothetical protein